MVRNDFLISFFGIQARNRLFVKKGGVGKFKKSAKIIDQIDFRKMQYMFCYIGWLIEQIRVRNFGDGEISINSQK